MDSGSPFHFIHHCGIGDFWTFVSISHTTNGRLFCTTLGEMTDADKIMDPRHFESHDHIRHTSGSGLIQKSGFESRITFGWNFGVGGGLRSLSALVANVCIHGLNQTFFRLGCEAKWYSCYSWYYIIFLIFYIINFFCADSWKHRQAVTHQ